MELSITRDYDPPIPLEPAQAWRPLIEWLDAQAAPNREWSRDDLEALRHRAAETLWRELQEGNERGENGFHYIHGSSVWDPKNPGATVVDGLLLADMLDFLVTLLGPHDAVTLTRGDEP